MNSREPQVVILSRRNMADKSVLQSAINSRSDTRLAWRISVPKSWEIRAIFKIHEVLLESFRTPVIQDERRYFNV